MKRAEIIQFKGVEMKRGHLDCKFQDTLILADLDMQRKIRKKRFVKCLTLFQA